MTGLAVQLETGAEIPSTISCEDNLLPIDRKVSWCWKVIAKIGEILRNAFYLPLYNKKIDPQFELNQQLGEKISLALKAGKIINLKNSDDIDLIRSHFTVRDIEVHLSTGGISRLFHVRLFYGENLKLFLFSFNGNRETVEGVTGRWEPKTIKEISTAPLAVLKALEQSGIRCDSLMATSLGNVIMEGLEGFSSHVPETLIINRGLTSVQKVANQLYSFPLNRILYAAAKLTGWDADPEQKLMNFLEREKSHKVVIIEAKNDYYFSGNNAFSPDLHKRIQRLGIPIFRGSFYPFIFHTRAHHAISLDHLTKNAITQIFADTLPLSMKDSETVADTLAKNLFSKEKQHTCFLVSGNDATLDIATARDAVPLLLAFIKSKKSLAAEDEKEAAS